MTSSMMLYCCKSKCNEFNFFIFHAMDKLFIFLKSVSRALSFGGYNICLDLFSIFLTFLLPIAPLKEVPARLQALWYLSFCVFSNASSSNSLSCSAVRSNHDGFWIRKMLQNHKNVKIFMPGSIGRNTSTCDYKFDLFLGKTLLFLRDRRHFYTALSVLHSLFAQILTDFGSETCCRLLGTLQIKWWLPRVMVFYVNNE